MLLWLFLFGCANPEKPSGYSSVTGSAHTYVSPLIKGVDDNQVMLIQADLPADSDPVVIRNLRFSLSTEAVNELESVSIHDHGKSPDFDSDSRTFMQKVKASDFEIPVRIHLQPGTNYLWVTAKLKKTASIDKMLAILAREMVDSRGKKYRIVNMGHEGDPFTKRKGVAIRIAGESKVHTYRIPGLITTKKGTLIAVYDVRYDGSYDLPANIDIGMSRSEDGGYTWEPMKIIMDMGRPQQENGVGDPCIVYDAVQDKIIVAGLWSKGDRAINGSGPGLSPDETGQFMLTESLDDGKTWTAKPRSITPMVKDHTWKIFFAAPGIGITMSNGTIVLPAQYWDATGTPFSTIVFSEDGGQTWRRGNGAKSNTTECQVVEVDQGVLMLNMRDNRGKFRSVATTDNMGETWNEHRTSYKTLIDPICMAGFFKAEMNYSGSKKQLLFFSNPASSSERENLGIKLSRDMGESWGVVNLIDERRNFGYSVMTKIDANTIGLLYEGRGDLYFMRIPVNELK